MANKETRGIILKDQLMETVTEYKYLGQIISTDDRKNKELSPVSQTLERNFGFSKIY